METDGDGLQMNSRSYGRNHSENNVGDMLDGHRNSVRLRPQGYVAGEEDRTSSPTLSEQVALSYCTEKVQF
jgi:hypothetical protein